MTRNPIYIAVIVTKAMAGRRKNRFAGWWEYTVFYNGEVALTGGCTTSREACEDLAWEKASALHRSPPCP